MSDELNNIEKLNRKLYQKKNNSERTERSGFSAIKTKVKTDWGRPQADLVVAKADGWLENSFLIKILIGAILFFVLTLAGAGYIIFSEGNVISSDKVNLQVTSPGLIKAGQSSRLSFSISNSNKVSLEEAELLVEFPDGTRSPLAPDEDFKRYREVIGTVAPGEVINKSIQAILFGQEESQHEIIATLQYKIPGSNASYLKEEAVTIAIDSSPVGINVKAPDQISAGQALALEVEVFSNSESVVSDVMLTAELPLGFKITDTSPALTGSGTVWNIGDLNVGDKKIIQINGVVDGQDGEVKTFKFLAGQRGSGGNQAGLALNEVIKTIALDRPFVNAQLVINGSSLPDPVVKAGQNVRVDVEWVNNLPAEALNVEIDLLVDGKVVDFSSVRASRGFFDSNTKTITWDKSTLSDLASLEPGEKGKTSFSFRTNRLLGVEGSIINPLVDMKMVVAATSAGNQDARNIVTRLNRVIKVETDYQLASKIFYSVGPFTNTGPIPPKVGENTSYTVSWSAVNSSNDVADGKVTAVLPSYVEWLGVTSPAGEDVSYDSFTRTVTWNLGNVEAGTGVVSRAREASFQISFLPSLSQVGQEPDLVNDISLSGFDTFTGTTVNWQTNNLQTKTPDDPNSKFGDYEVVQ